MAAVPSDASLIQACLWGRFNIDDYQSDRWNEWSTKSAAPLELCARRSKKLVFSTESTASLLSLTMEGFVRRCYRSVGFYKLTHPYVLTMITPVDFAGINTPGYSLRSLVQFIVYTTQAQGNSLHLPIWPLMEHAFPILMFTVKSIFIDLKKTG